MTRRLGISFVSNHIYNLPISLRIGISLRTEKQQNRIAVELKRLLYICKSILRHQRRKSGGDRAGFAGDDTGSVQATHPLDCDLIRAGEPGVCLAEQNGPGERADLAAVEPCHDPKTQAASVGSMIAAVKSESG